MVCLYCGKKTSVTNSRLQKNSNQTWRRRKCYSCKSIVTTIEKFQLNSMLTVVKHNATYEPFSDDKLFVSILKAIEHLPTPIITARALTDTTLNSITKDKPLKPQISTKQIALHTSKVLKNFDAAASIKYLSFQTSLKSSKDVHKSLK